MKATIVGIGLIGGSIALDLRKSGIATTLVGVDLNGQHASKAVELGLVDRIESEEKALSSSDIIILSIPVGVICALLPSILDAVNKHAVVIDVGSTKGLICKAVSNHPNRHQFVAAHPLAGTENSGPEAALEGLFREKVNIICEKEKTSEEALRTATATFDSMGMKTIFMDA